MSFRMLLLQHSTQPLLPFFLLIFLFAHDKHLTLNRLFPFLFLKLVIDPLLIITWLFDEFIHKELWIQVTFVVHNIGYLFVDAVPLLDLLFVLLLRTNGFVLFNFVGD